ncbi:Crp/Fnr family transcriptional regulator [Lentilactobacillus kisonensis]|uniref:Crp/Fnr family transcriptional regulator n=1 Tax=Lentilactobacillus kisonensis TaxID=481722 RepID=UPI001FB37E3D|nr:Crp/Fnr family transcriptional regulator [Lentilactobacillus kisonensis]
MKDRNAYHEYADNLRTHPEFGPLSDDDIEKVISTMKIKRYHRGQVLFDQGDSRANFYYLIDGVVKSFHWDEDGEEQLYLYIRQDKAFPYIGLFDDDNYAYTVESMTEVKLAEIPMSVYEEVLQNTPELMVNAIREMSRIINMAETQTSKKWLPRVLSVGFGMPFGF